MEKPVLLFDGVCNLCNGTVQFVIKRDKNDYFRFAALQSAYGQNFLGRQNRSTTDFDTFILVEGDSYATKSTAVLKVFRHLSGLWPVLYVLIVVPKFIRDSIYSLIARTRYRVFGKKESCMVPDKDILSRFVK